METGLNSKAYKKALRSKKKYYKKFGDDSNADYAAVIQKNAYIGDALGVNNVLIGDLKQNAHFNEADKDFLEFDRQKGIIVGNIRMGFGSLQNFNGYGVSCKGNGIHTILDGFKFIWTDNVYKGYRSAE